jgi:hypothetical protein
LLVAYAFVRKGGTDFVLATAELSHPRPQGGQLACPHGAEIDA